MADSDHVPDSHPRAASLRARQRLVNGVRAGLTSQHGLIAHGRGEAFDYLLGERTLPSAEEAATAAAGALLMADHPVLSVNGNVAALAPEATMQLAETVDAVVEVNLFHREQSRVAAIADHLREHGEQVVLGTGPDARLPGLEHDRALVHSDGIYAADVVVVPLEDGDRAAALGERGITRIVIDLNPLSRSAQEAEIPICDNLTRALPQINDAAVNFLETDAADLQHVVSSFDPDAARTAAEQAIRSGNLQSS